MEKVLSTNNGQAGWEKLSTFGLRHKKSILGFNRYGGKNGSVFVIDKESGMKIEVMAPSYPKTERIRSYERTISFRSRKGRPALFSFPKIQNKRGRKPLSPEVKAEREALKAELAGLVFYNHPMRQRGRKPQSAEQKAEKQALKDQIKQLEAIANGQTPGKRGRPSKKELAEKEMLAKAKPGDTVSTKGGYWVILPQGIPSFVSA